MEVFLSRIQQLLPVLGSDLLIPIAQASAKPPPGGVLSAESKEPRHEVNALRMDSLSFATPPPF